MTARPRNGGARGKADLHIHTLYSDGTASVAQVLDWVEHQTDLDLITITDHERIDGALRARELHAAGDFHFELSVGEEITTRRGHLLALFIEERIPALRPLGETVERIHAAGGIAVAPHTMAPLTPSVGGGSMRQLQRDTDAGRHLDAIELMNPSAAASVPPTRTSWRGSAPRGPGSRERAPRISAPHSRAGSSNRPGFTGARGTTSTSTAGSSPPRRGTSNTRSCVVRNGGERRYSG